MWTKEQEQYLIESYENPDIRFKDIVEYLGKTKGEVQAKVKKLGLVKKRVDQIHYTEEMDRAIEEGYKDATITVWELAKRLQISDKSLQRRAKQLGLTKVKYTPSLEDEKTDLIREWSQKEGVTWEELSDKVGLDAETIRERLRMMGLKKKPSGRTRRIVPDTKEFYDDLGNPRYSAPDLAEKYGVSNSCILQWRKKIYGEFKNQLHTTERMTTADKVVAKALDDLDLVFQFNKRVGHWKVDFYLGQKGVIEVNGEYWHNLKNVREKDERKNKWLTDNDYKVLNISEDDTKSPKLVREKIKAFWVSLIRENK